MWKIRRYGNLLCSVAVELGLLLLLVVIVLAPIHASCTRHLTLVQTIDETHAIVRGNVEGLAVQDVLPFYRFSGNWKLPIGKGEIESISRDQAQIVMLPSTMAWPLGRSGTIAQDAAGNCWVSMGSNLGIREGDLLNVFVDRVWGGTSRVEKVELASARIDLETDLDDLTRITVSEYKILTQAAPFVGGWLNGFEMGLILFALLAYTTTYLHAKQSPFHLFGKRLRSIPWPRALLFWSVNAIAGIFCIWFVANVSLQLIAHFGSKVIRVLTGEDIDFGLQVNQILPYAYALLGIGFYSYLVGLRRSPILDFWQFLSYKKLSTGPCARGFFLWLLHLVIVYVFASTLWDFLLKDIQAAAKVAEKLNSLEDFFELLKYVVWSMTVIGVLFGYGYSIVSILWGQYIRNLDFTPVGWLTNGLCYGPIFGFAVWSVTPSYTGMDPIVTDGPLRWLVLILGGGFNVLYMMSIWNLGTKFDLMTDKGVRTSGFFSVIRHPNYTLEAAMFFATELVGMATIGAWFGGLMFFFLYWIRSEREDNFMGYSSPDYEQYRKETPYKFVPGVF